MNRQFYVILVFVLVFTLGNARAQDSSAFADTTLYDAVLEHLFQHEVEPRSSDVQLRYTYCDRGEMQIVVHQLEDSNFRLDVRYVAPAMPNVWNQLARLVQSNPTLNPESAIGLIKMSHKTVVVRNTTALATLIEKASSLAVPLLNPSPVTLDGMAYAIAVRSISEDVNVTLQGPQRADKSDSQLIRWMGQVRSSTELELKEQ